MLERDLDGAREVLERPECANDARAVVRATIAAWTGDYEAALRVLRDAIERSPNASNREAFVALAARSGHCDEAVEIANGFAEAEGSGERELLFVALAPRCPTAFQGEVAIVMRRLSGQFASESTLSMARALVDPGAPPLSPAVGLAIHALVAHALVASSAEETERHLGEAARLYESVRWRGSLPSYYAAVALAARVRLETTRFAIPPPARNDIYWSPQAIVSEGTALCAPPLWVAGNGVLRNWPDLYARASLDRARLMRRVGERRDIADPASRALALRPTLGISEAIQRELSAELERCDNDTVSYCARHEVAADVVFARGALRVEEQPPTNPLEWLPMLPANEMRPTYCDSCEPRPILPPRELIPPRTR